MVEWSYYAFEADNFKQFNEKLKEAIEAVAHQGLQPTVSMTHTYVPQGMYFHYSAVVIGTRNGQAVQAPAADGPSGA